jgi:phospholipid/cholesterol/gamma-HCH transport system permease protein
MPPTMAKPHANWQETSPGRSVLRVSGSWTAEQARNLEALIATAKTPAPSSQEIVISCAELGSLDTLGAYLLEKLRRDVSQGGAARFADLSESQARLIAEIADTPVVPPPRAHRQGAYHMLSDVGEAVVDAGRDVRGGVAFFGHLTVAFGRLITGRTPFRFASVASQLEQVAMRGAPIIVLISFLVGAIIAQQSIFQLQRFGTVHFVADLIGVLVLRELGVLLTSIMVAGRSGSSFTAEIGSMKMREEVDALQTMGLDPMEVLVLPRLIALLIGLPLLTFISSMSAIFGGAVVALVYGGVSFDTFFARLQNIIGVNTFMVGMIKAPFMAMVIGMIACIEGFAVRGSAESLGQHTTDSVVKSIFVVIVVDGLFAMFFASIRY